ncbi:hypothetical protein ON010_g9867 [Phytophthora cinnamomi]|nr:hypothetical protein ON010_g9867 [Phytophthora cinnamomi]
MSIREEDVYEPHDKLRPCGCHFDPLSLHWQAAMEALKKTFKGAAQGLSEEEQRHQKCEDMREKALAKCSRIKFLVDAMEKLGCSLEPGFFSSVDCEGKINGGFHLDNEGKPGSCIAWLLLFVAAAGGAVPEPHPRPGVDGSHYGTRTDPRVRAAALSGDCNWKYEFFRKNFNVNQQHQVCTLLSRIAAMAYSTADVEGCYVFIALPGSSARGDEQNCPSSRTRRARARFSSLSQPNTGGRMHRQGVRVLLPRLVTVPRDPIVTITLNHRSQHAASSAYQTRLHPHAWQLQLIYTDPK